MTEMRAGDLEKGAHVRMIGDDGDFGEIIDYETRGDDVLITVAYPDEVRPCSLPILDCCDEVEVLT